MVNKDKDYSIFTRNFNYCFECGMILFYQSLCGKCEKSVNYFLQYFKFFIIFVKKIFILFPKKLIILLLAFSYFNKKFNFLEKQIGL